MQTEVFHQPIEDINLIKEIAQKLGLVKQVEKAEKPFPVIPMTPLEYFVYNTLCPTHTKLEEFEDELIPLDVLREVLRAKEEGNFSKFEVWTIDKVKHDDPVVVGYTKGKYSWEQVPCLIARWGNELLPFNVLLPDAKRIAWDNIQRVKRIFKTRLEEIESFLTTDQTTFTGSFEASKNLRYVESYHLDNVFPSIQSNS